MSKIKDAPIPLRSKFFLTCLVGVVCLLIGIALLLFLKDKIMLFLSIWVFVFSIFKAIEIYRLIANKQYEIVEGTCVGIICFR